jgi:hypothetical protein
VALFHGDWIIKDENLFLNLPSIEVFPLQKVALQKGHPAHFKKVPKVGEQIKN